MYQILSWLNRRCAMLLATVWLMSLLLPEIQALLTWDTMTGLQVLVTMLAVMVIVDKPLGRLSFDEISRQMDSVNLDEVRAKFWQDEQRRGQDAERRK